VPAAAAPMKMVLGVSVPLQLCSDVTLQSQYGVLPSINQRQPSSQATTGFGLSIISAPVPTAPGRQTEHLHHLRHTENHGSRGRGHRH